VKFILAFLICCNSVADIFTMPKVIQNPSQGASNLVALIHLHCPQTIVTNPPCIACDLAQYTNCYTPPIRTNYTMQWWTTGWPCIGASWALQLASSPNGPWTNVATNPAPWGGDWISFIVTNDLTQNRFYRLKNIWPK
jgi:hypothetical protein